MRRTPTGQRPQLNQAHSSGWRWPHLVPIQEQHARASQESRSSARSPRAQSAHNKGEQMPSTTELPTGNPPIKDAFSQAPVLSAAGSVFPVEKSGTGPTEGRHPSEAQDIVSSPTMDDNLPTHYELPKSPVLSVAGTASPVGSPGTGSIERRHSGEAQGSSSAAGGSDTGPMQHRTSSQAEASSFAVGDFGTGSTKRRDSNQDEASSSEVGHSGTGSTERTHTNEAEDNDSQVEDSDTNPAGRKYASEVRDSVSTISGVGIHSSATEDGHMSNNETNKSIDDASDEAGQGNSTRHGETSNWKKPEAQSILEDEAPDVAEEAEAADVVLGEEATPAPTPVAPVTDRVSIPGDEIPYYATPKIMVHKPSESFQSDTSGPRTIDEILARERGDLAFQEHLPAREVPLASAGSPAMPQLTRLPTGAVVHKALKLKRRNLYLRKARNLAARKTILKITLGRQLAVPTKQSLRQLANGENVIAQFPVVS